MTKTNVNFYKEGSRLIIVIDGVEDDMANILSKALSTIATPVVGLEPISNEIPDAPDLSKATKIEHRQSSVSAPTTPVQTESHGLTPAKTNEQNSELIDLPDTEEEFNLGEELMRDEVQDESSKMPTSEETVQSADEEYTGDISTEPSRIDTIIESFTAEESAFYQELSIINNMVEAFTTSNKEVPAELLDRRNNMIQTAVDIANDYICNGVDEIVAEKILVLFATLLPKKYIDKFDYVCASNLAEYINNCPGDQKVVDAIDIITVIAMYM